MLKLPFFFFLNNLPCYTLFRNPLPPLFPWASLLLLLAYSAGFLIYKILSFVLCGLKTLTLCEERPFEIGAIHGPVWLQSISVTVVREEMGKSINLSPSVNELSVPHCTTSPSSPSLAGFHGSPGSRV